jgi:hypothetical protein
MSPYDPSPDVIEVIREPAPSGAASLYRTFGETLRGLKTTFARIIEGPTTIQYPEEKTPVYPRFRGRHKLHRFEDTLLAVRGRLPGRLHPRRRRREHPGEPHLRGRAVRGGV